ncbi:MAG TPA: methyltransferase domain-containing protein, partial [Actinomycetota bacterium]|nr:methyltransferase domain-containing protein [Actinomycetota bacterium]
MSEQTQDYIYDAASADERRRLELLERLNDPATVEHLEAIGVGPGWRCLEVGGGGGSLTRWLCDRVGPEGRVVATDLDTRFLDEIEAANLEVRRHDVLEDELESGAYDLVHSRFLLEHLPRYRDALARMIDAVAPGGWILVEDVDFAGALLADPAERPGYPRETVAVAAELSARLLSMAPMRGIQPELGRHLPALLAEAGLEVVGGEGRTTWLWTGTEQAELGRLSLDRVTKVAAEMGAITEEERAGYMRVVTEPGIGTFSPLRFGAWGRKPGSPD